jgi:hypothetical protein
MFTNADVTNYSQSRFSNKSDKKFCGVCKNAGKPVALYESHFTRSVPGPKGIVMCPTILNAVCNTCGKKGHFTNSKQCPNNKHSLKDNRRMSLVKGKCEKGSHTTTNMYSVLDDFDYELPIVKRQKVPCAATMPCATMPCASVPCAINEEIKTLAPGGVSFADMLKKPVPKPVEQFGSGYKISQKLQETIVTDGEKLAIKILSDKSRMSQLKFRTSWLSDDESDDETAW